MIGYKPSQALEISFTFLSKYLQNIRYNWSVKGRYFMHKINLYTTFGAIIIFYIRWQWTIPWWELTVINTLRPRQNGCLFADDILKRIFPNENVWISIKISLKFVPKVPINNIAVLVQIKAWRRPGYKPLSEPMMVSLLTHICVTRPQWVIGLLQLCWYLGSGLKGEMWFWPNIIIKSLSYNCIQWICNIFNLFIHFNYEEHHLYSVH